MSKFDEVKDKLKNIDIKKMVEFVKRNVRYFTAGALFVVLVVILVNFTTPTGLNESNANEATEATVSVETFQENAYPEINTLIESYYTAYAAGDIATLNTLATPISANEQGYISLYSQYVESYQNMIYYTKSGLDANSYMVNVYVEVKFEGVETLAPGLDFFYVRTNEDGTLYIDNLYSQYNMRQNENALDTSVEALINEYEKQADVIALLQDVQQKYESTVASDEALANMITVTIPNAISEWVATIINQEPTTEEVAEEQPEEEVPVEEQPSEEAPEEVVEEPEATSETVTATSTVNVRSAADQSSSKLGQVESGTTLTRIGTDGEWSIIEYNGSTGYIKSEYLTTGTVEEEGTASNAIAEGTVITLTGSTNIREGMSETSDKVGVAYQGEKVTVVMSYAEGWTKVTWKNKTGYIKTDLLQ